MANEHNHQSARNTSTTKKFQFRILDLVGVMVAVSAVGGLWHLPPSWLHAIPLYLILYTARYRIRQIFPEHPKSAFLAYAVVAVALLPYLYHNIWHFEQPTDLGLEDLWYNGPITFMSISTISFIYDIGKNVRHTLHVYVARSVLEVALVPIWLQIWIIVWLLLPVL